MAKRPQSAAAVCRWIHWKLMTSAAIITIAAACTPIAAKRGAKLRPQPPNIQQKPVKQALGPTNPLHVATAYWAGQYQKNPNDPKAALSYARNLKAIGSKDRALAVLKRAHAQHPGHTEIASEYGRLALEAGQVQMALRVLKRAEQPKGRTDWRVLSAQGTAHAKLGDHATAQQYFVAALKQQPQSPTLRNNLALSYALSGSADKAETMLRQTIAAGHDTPKLRQNLALVLGLQSKFDEAQQIASVDLARDKAAANMKYLRGMVRQRAVAQAVTQSPPVAAAADRPTQAPVTTASVSPAPMPARKPAAAQPAQPQPRQLTSKTMPLPWSTRKSLAPLPPTRTVLADPVPLPDPKPARPRTNSTPAVPATPARPQTRRTVPAATPAPTPKPMPRQDAAKRPAAPSDTGETRVLAWQTRVEPEKAPAPPRKSKPQLYPDLN